MIKYYYDCAWVIDVFIFHLFWSMIACHCFFVLLTLENWFLNQRNFDWFWMFFLNPVFFIILQPVETLYAITVSKFFYSFCIIFRAGFKLPSKKWVRQADQSYPKNGVILINDQCYPMQESILPLKKFKVRPWAITKIEWYWKKEI